jgi:hypothetical protein
LPASGYLLRETADGWSDLEHAALPVEEGSPMMPGRPEPVLGLAVSANGESILGVGGQTGTFESSTEPKVTEYETAAALRFPATDALDPDQTAPIVPPTGRATIAVAGQAACAAPCADQAADDLAPDTLLSSALATVRERTTADPGEVRAFLYTGGRLESEVGASGYESELNRLASLFAGADPLPVLTAPSTDLLAAGGSLFSTAFSGFGPTAGGTPYYAFRSEPPGGPPLAVMVLDLSTGALGSAQEAWLRKELAAARSAGLTAVAVGNASPGITLPDPPAGVEPPAQVQDPAALASILIEGGAVAYFFDYPGANVIGALPAGGRAILAIGTGTLGYGKPGTGAEDWLGSSAFLLVEVESASATGQGAGVLVRAIPNIASLTLHGSTGPRLAAGEAENFEALGRLPAGGIRVDRAEGASVFSGPEPYVTFPFPSRSRSCTGANCPFAVPFEYAFTSSDPEVGDFVSPGSGLNSEGRRSTDQHSGFFCAKSPGTTTVSITAGGLSYSEPIVVTEGERGEGCRLPEPAPPLEAVPAPVETHTSEPAPTEPASPPPHHVAKPQGGLTPSPAPTHPAPTQVSQAPLPPAPVAPSVPGAPAPPPVNPVASPYPPPGVQPAPPTGVSPAAQPVPQGAAQPTVQVVTAPTPGFVPAPGVAPGEVADREAAIQRQHLAVRVRPGPATVAAGRGSSFSAGSGTTPLVGVIGAAALFALAGGIGVGLARRDRRAYATTSAARTPSRSLS